MNNEAIAAFKKYMLDQGFSVAAVTQYSKGMAEYNGPPDDPDDLFPSLMNFLSDQKKKISNSAYKFLHAAVSAYFYMLNGQTLSSYKKSHEKQLLFEDYLQGYKKYCLDYLHISTEVTNAALREVSKFLAAIVGNEDPENFQWNKITAKTISEYVADHLSYMKNSSIGVSLTAIRRFFRYLSYSEIPIHPSVLTLPLTVPIWSKNNSLPVVLCEEDFQKLEHHTFTRNRFRNRAILLCYTDLGLRSAEVANLNLQDIHWHEGLVTIKKVKNSYERELPISRRLGKALEEYLLNEFPPDHGKALFYKSIHKKAVPARITTGSVRSIIRYAMKKENISGYHVGPHAIRRSVGSKLYQAGNGLKTVSDVLGHSSVGVTKAYVRIDIDSLRIIAEPWPCERRL